MKPKHWMTDKITVSNYELTVKVFQGQLYSIECRWGVRRPLIFLVSLTYMDILRKVKFFSETAKKRELYGGWVCKTSLQNGARYLIPNYSHMVIYNMRIIRGLPPNFTELKLIGNRLETIEIQRSYSK